MAVIAAFLEILQRPTTGDVVFELLVFMTPVWVAVVVGVLVGWAWKPQWVHRNVDPLDSSTAMGGDASKSSGIVSPQFFASFPSLSSLKVQIPACLSRITDLGDENDSSSSTLPSLSNSDHSSSKINNEKPSLVIGEDVRHLHRLVEEKDGGPAWIKMMDKSTPNMSYQAWRRDPEGPPQYRSKTVYENATPEMVRDFFWDDEFRLKWDDMLLHAETLEECPATGTMLVHWVRKFPFFCREYIIGRRIWESGPAYYCVTKGVPCTRVPRREKPRRVDLYYSSWCIHAAESKRDGQLTSCEVLLFHHEDMGIPWEIAKLGIRQGMWGAVKKIDTALRAYQKSRSSGAPVSRGASLAQINTKVSVDYLESQEDMVTSESEVKEVASTSKRNIRRVMIIGGAIALACSLDRGILTKAAIFGVARRFANNGRRL